jgi:glycosyltransferase involved in cell wall biosynthesis
LVNPDQARPYRERVLQLIEDPKLRKRIADQARASVLDRTWQRNNDKLFEHYAAVMTDEKSRAK